MAIDIGEVVRFGLVGWMKQEGALKYLLAYFVFLAAVAYASLFFVSSIANPLGSIKTATFPAMMDALMHTFAFTSALGIVSFVVGTAFCFIFISRALKAKGRTYNEITVEKWLGLVVLEIALALVAIFSIFNLKKLLILVAGIVALIIAVVLLAVGMVLGIAATIAGIILIIIAIILFIIYFINVIRNSVRLYVAPVAYVEKDRRIVESLRLAWEKSSGNLWGIFATLIVVFIAVAIISLILSAPSSLYAFSKTLTGLFSGAGTGQLNNLMLFNDPVYLVLYIPTVVGEAIAGIITLFATVGVYDVLVGKSGAAAGKAKPIARRSFKK